MAHLNLFVLGQPRLERDGRPIELNLRKALALLVYLAVSGQGTVATRWRPCSGLRAANVRAAPACAAHSIA